jgi:hypothetical protein
MLTGRTRGTLRRITRFSSRFPLTQIEPRINPLCPRRWRGGLAIDIDWLRRRHRRARVPERLGRNRGRIARYGIIDLFPRFVFVGRIGRFAYQSFEKAEHGLQWWVMHVFRRPAAVLQPHPGSPKPLKTGNRQNPRGKREEPGASENARKARILSAGTDCRGSRRGDPDASLW